MNHRMMQNQINNREREYHLRFLIRSDFADQKNKACHYLTIDGLVERGALITGGLKSDPLLYPSDPQ